MTGYGYEDPRSIFSEESRRKAGTRTPREILDDIKNEGTRETSEKVTQAIEQIESAVSTIEIELAYIKAAIAKLKKGAER